LAKLEDLTRGSKVEGIVADSLVTILNVDWHGSDVIELTYRNELGEPGNELIFRDREADLVIDQPGTPWAFDSDGSLFKLASEAYRIKIAYLFDPWMAVHLSLVDPLPHQISAVYEDMLPKQPLRLLLADDPGAGKTIMTGLYIKELMLRGDLERCLIVAPGNLTEQWQDELYEKLRLEFELFSNARLNDKPSANPFKEIPLGIARLDRLSRNEELQELLGQADWDLIVFDEAHKLSASVFGREVKYTKRFNLGRILSQRTRHLLLLTATPHNGKEEDFQLFMSHLDPDRFEGPFREGVHAVEVKDLMVRRVKEQLLRFDGTRLFPERKAYTVNYKLSNLEAKLYEQVTQYVREEFNRAEQAESGRKGSVGFALTILQRRLASSPEAIYQSLKRRKERLENRLREEELLERGENVDVTKELEGLDFDQEDIDSFDELTDEELEEAENQLIDYASSAMTIEELKVEILILEGLEVLANKVRRSDKDTKWSELSKLLQEQNEMFNVNGQRRKLVIFTEHKDTLSYLTGRIRSLLGKPNAVVTIHGGKQRDERKKIQNSFVQDKDVIVLVATDAAGEGINLQRAHLMVNYDLPWNPTRLEQRFGRIHRIGQTEVCHLWNLVAEETREGNVYSRLLQKIEEQRKVLGDTVFDVLGELFRGKSLRNLLVEAVRYGDREDVRDRLFETIDNLADQNKIRELIEDQTLLVKEMNLSKIQKIHEEFERAEARRLQPHFVASFFVAAFKQLGGSIYSRENKRYEITKVPGSIVTRARLLGRGHVLSKYERATFHKSEITQEKAQVAEFITPGHPLMEAVLDLILERYRGLLRDGAFLVDSNDFGEEIRALVYLEHSIKDGKPDLNGNRRVISRRMQFVEIDSEGVGSNAGSAPFLDYETLAENDNEFIQSFIKDSWINSDLEGTAISHAMDVMVPAHLEETKKHREKWVDKTVAAVKDRLTKEINYWDRRAEDLKAQEQAGKKNAKLNSSMARKRADNLQARLQNRLDVLKQERNISAQAPILIGGAIIIPQGLLDKLRGEESASDADALFGKNRKAIELAAMEAVMNQELKEGYQPIDVSKENLGWDIESNVGEGRIRFIEVKGRNPDATTVTLSKNEILAGLNKPDDYFLAIAKVDVDGDKTKVLELRYTKSPFHREPDFAAIGVNYKIAELQGIND
jgi:superfamily II DNA or RNA helicase